MTKIGYHSPLSRLLGILAVVGLAALANSCGTTPATYSSPAWADGISDGAAPYYYFPDYGMYYDATGQQYYYRNNGAWASSAGTAPASRVENAPELAPISSINLATGVGSPGTTSLA